MPVDLYGLLVQAHGATGTWLDEIVEIGLPIGVFVGLWLWSSRKGKSKEKPNKKP